MGRFPEGFGVLAAFGVLLCALLVGLFALPAFQELPLTGRATHGTYNAFSAPENGFRVGNGFVFASDTVVYKNVWYSVNGSAWQPLSLSGSAYGSSSSWLSGAASIPLPAALSGVGEHYLIVYSCTWSSEAWDCHGGTPGTGGWQLQVLTVSSDSCGVSTCTPEEYCSAQNACLLSVPGNTYFVAVEGNDNNPGNFTHPFATWQKAVMVSQPGDITYFRGGVYRPTTHFMSGSYDTGAAVRIYPGVYGGASGTVDAPIRYFAYPPDWSAGNLPILDGSLLSPETVTGYNNGIDMNNVEYLHFRGLTIRNIHQAPPHFPSYGGKNYTEASGIGSTDSANLLFENMVVHDVDGRAYQHWSGSPQYFQTDTTSWINCDAYNLYDRYARTPGNAADGWKIGSYYGNDLLWEGCRAWNYSDDGFDPHGSGRRTIKDCWAMSTDYFEGLSSGWNVEGNGFKFTAISVDTPDDEKSVVMINSIAAFCVNSGVFNNVGLDFSGSFPNNGIFYNNLFYRNGVGILDHHGGGGPNSRTSSYRNNLVFGSTYIDPPEPDPFEVRIYYPSIYDAKNNTWIPTMQSGNDAWPGWEYNPAYSVTDDDFIEVDATQLTAPRKADGSLPDITFGHLALGSELIDGGAVVPGYHCATAGAHPGEGCKEWYGAAPDLGPFEYNG